MTPFLSMSSLFPELADPQKGVNFVGVGGIGMSALARWFLATSRVEGLAQNRSSRQNRQDPSASSGRAYKRLVSGSDLAKSAITLALVKEGLGVRIGHKKGHISRRVGLVIYSKAAKSTNPELVAAKALGIPALSYSEAVGRLTRMYKTIAVAGAHGKSTTTALAALILRKAGLDPTVIVGTNLKEFSPHVIARSRAVARRRGNLVRLGSPRFARDDSCGVNFRAGRSKWLVLEADEFDKSFLQYSPTVAVVTNIDLEHLDTYKNLADVKKAFLQFIANTRTGGAIILHKDSKPLLSLRPYIQKIAKDKKWAVYWYSLNDRAIGKKIKRILQIPGTHNLSNALAAHAVGRTLKIPEKKILSAIGAYRGSWRRMEFRGKLELRIKNKELSNKEKSFLHNSKFVIPVFDDYAHHPTEIRATLRAFKEKYPKSPIVCIYQPHQALRLKKLWKDFINAFDDTDILILIPMYRVAGRDRVDPRFNSKTLAAAIKRKYSNRAVFYLSSPKNIRKFIIQFLKPKTYNLKPVVVMMGAGDIVNFTHLLTGHK